VYSPLRWVAAPVYFLICQAEIVLFKAIEPLFLKQKTSQPKNVTAVIKAFERPRRCRELIKSIKRQYPELPIIVVDDSRNQEYYEGVTNLKMNFDSGVSAGRSAGLDMVKTDYFINLDDDRLFCHRTNISRAIDIMEQYREIDLMGGSVLDLPLFIRH
jgi:glycosyltransferase involved in cell wall biosynthesis